MTFIEWSDDYNTGIFDIDKEHRRLFALINDIYDKAEVGSAETSVKATIEALVDYVNYHFDREETLMDACCYHDTESHKLEHRRLRSQVEAYRTLYERNPESFDMADFIEFLIYWIQDHILQSDMAYVPYVRRRVAGIAWEASLQIPPKRLAD